MKVLIEFNEQRFAIMLPIELAGQAAELVAQATVMKKDYWPDSPWEKASDRELVISFITDESSITPLSEREKALQAAAEKKNSDWATAYLAKDVAEKRVKELETALAAIQSVTVCQTVETVVDPAPPADDDGESF